MRDIDWSEMGSYDWLAQVWIPVALGIVTAILAGVAVWTSHRASVLARKIESMRDADEKRRYAEQRSERLLTMSREEARAMLRWARLTFEIRGWMHDPRAPALPVERDPRVARIDAMTTLDQSLVPGARSLLRLTELELEHRHERMPKSEEFPDKRLTSGLGGTWKSNMRNEAFRWREHRTMERIRTWGLDPERSTPLIDDELALALNTPNVFWDYRHAFPDQVLAEWVEDAPKASSRGITVGVVVNEGPDD
ncbi:hypothetical protein [Microterricola viridarii]|uniref:Uncharacterized protein n=1 Tax=Microterricola viridarii TaxID=412690 RepID=A0A1H1YLF8_9MICO|nr:hypothetical protein [Microterricola viridarii]SDT22283.1 hypothetical protein SAMN04489834_3129 [Microterricola viridarii]